MIELVRDILLGRPSAEEATLCERLRAEVDAVRLGELAQDAPASIREWTENQHELRRLILRRDPRRFLRWDVVQRTMFVDEPGYLAVELSALQASPDWSSRWQRVVAESSSGSPRRLRQYPSSSGNLVHSSYHALRFQQVTGVDIASLGAVLEFGAGYGNLCRVLHRLGFAGAYTIFELPLFAALQRYYLRLERVALDRVRHVTEVERLRSAVADLPRPTLFVATWSISEAPLELRAAVMQSISELDYFLIAYQDRFGEVDNVAYFDAFCRDTAADVRWQRVPIEHLPGHSYLFGKSTRARGS